MSSEEDSEAGEGCGTQVLWAAAEGAGCALPGEKESQGWPCHSQQPQSGEGGCSLFSQVNKLQDERKLSQAELGEIYIQY